MPISPVLPRPVAWLALALAAPAVVRADARDEVGAAVPLPAAVDLRADLGRMGLPPRGQGARGTCSIFTTCAALEVALAKASGRPARLSPEFLNWAASQSCGHPSDGNFFHHALAGYERFGLCDDGAMAYQPGYDAALAPSAEAIADAVRRRDAARDAIAVRWIVPWESSRFGVAEAPFREILATLARGFPVAAGSAHSRLLVGYRIDAAQPGGGAFVTLDSALARFDEVTFDYVKREVADVFWVETLPSGAAPREVVVADRGRSACTIVVPATRDAAIDHAARELATWLRAVGGVELPIVEEGREGEGPALRLGAGAAARAHGLDEAAAALGPDGVLLRTIGDDLFLLGGARGRLYAVYELLERFLGCRFLARDANVAPAREVVALPPIDHAYAPPFRYREVLAFDSGDGVTAARLRLDGGNTNQCLGRPNGAGEVVPGVVICPFVHSAESILPSGEHFASHPDWYGLVGGKRHGAPIGGQPCWTNPEVQQRCVEWIVDWLARHPGIECVDLSQNDAYPGSSGACECERCAAVVREEGSQHGPILRCVNAVAAAVAERFPGKSLETIAYQHTLATPKVTRPRDDVVIRLCQHACYFHGIDCPAIGGEYRDALRDWRAAAKSVWVWHYGVNFWNYLAPNPNLAALAADLKRYARDGIDGVMVQCDLQSPGGELAELRAYLCAQLLWDPSRDPLAIRRDFCAGCYGDAADDVLAFLARMDAWGAATPFHLPMNGWNAIEVTPPEVVADATAQLERGLAKCSDAAVRNRIEKLLLPFWLLQLSAPERHALALDAGAPLLARARRVIEANGITTLSEGPPNAAAVLAQLEQRWGRVAGG